MLKYLRYSNFQIAINFNPCGWFVKPIWFEYFPPYHEYSSERILYLKILMFRFMLAIDNGDVL